MGSIFEPDLTARALGRLAGNDWRVLIPYLERNMLDVLYYHDDFLGDEIRGSGASPGIYEEKTGVDGAIGILADQVNGIAELRASDGAGADNEYGGISLPELAFKGDQNCTVAMRIAIDDITTVKVEMGFTDVTTDAGAVLDLAGNTATADDAALWVRDTDDAGNATGWQAWGVSNGTPATKIEPTGFTAVNGAFETLMVACDGGDARFYHFDADGVLDYSSPVMSGSARGTIALVPWVFIQLRANTIDRNLQIDFISAWQRRT